MASRAERHAVSSRRGRARGTRPARQAVAAALVCGRDGRRDAHSRRRVPAAAGNDAADVAREARGAATSICTRSRSSKARASRRCSRRCARIPRLQRPSSTAAAIMSALGAPGVHPEGQFFPDTYRFPYGTSDVEVLRLAHDALVARLDGSMAQPQPRAAAEDGLRSADPRVDHREGDEPRRRAQAHRRRVSRAAAPQHALADRSDRHLWRWETRSTAILRREDLDRDTPYNTYTRAGLPPTPIALPGAGVDRSGGGARDQRRDLLRRDGPRRRQSLLLRDARRARAGRARLSAPSLAAAVMRGAFISLEGVEGVGKSTNVAFTADARASERATTSSRRASRAARSSASASASGFSTAITEACRPRSRRC